MRIYLEDELNKNLNYVAYLNYFFVIILTVIIRNPPFMAYRSGRKRDKQRLGPLF